MYAPRGFGRELIRRVGQVTGQIPGLVARPPAALTGAELLTADRADLPPASRLDRVYRQFIYNRFFPDGYGDLHMVGRFLQLKSQAFDRVDPRHLVTIDSVETLLPGAGVGSFRGAGPGAGAGTEPLRIVHASLESPINEHWPDLLPAECRRARIQIVLPAGIGAGAGARGGIAGRQSALGPQLAAALGVEPAADQDTSPPGPATFVQLSATGDHSFWRRRMLTAVPLARDHGIASIILENPFYGARKPAGQVRSNLRTMMDLFRMGIAIQYETMALLHWAERELRCDGRLGVAGLSMGGHMAALAVASWPRPLALVSCLGPFSAAGVFTHGVFGAVCDWPSLAGQLAAMSPEERDALLALLPEGSLDFGRDEDPSPLLDSLAHVIPREYHPAVRFTARLLDAGTALAGRNVGRPAEPRAALAFAAQHDAYVPLLDTRRFHKQWPGCEVRLIPHGHIGSFLTANGTFRAGMVTAMARLNEALAGAPSAARA
ncbi:hypothetical protein H696_02131 [Fonticula alba]|uniref:Uncharacterized protein n=1 Tax=Fonticula alba TaxID=691883 RepID=A0A058ZA46_FONAL|nr:hypothetical protein H696_02131 [Fonticula alba]KCV71179.1 hypothetical protein H696_02131 [Fonticula alba]|eukprot:XP_009494302.1 hypothetical protein H696_02131 [Fonticula alba]